MTKRPASPGEPAPLVQRLASGKLAVLVLVAVNLCVFQAHYRGVAQIPWDFPMGYYGFVAYWTTAIQHGVIPEWMPFEEMGYPFFANLQTGITYPPLWIFPLARIPYSMHAAIVVQALHVLWGALGAYALGRLFFGRGAPALLLGVAYHFFGGFYGNAQHTDIVRAFAWLPWLVYAAHLAPGQRTLAARSYALPFVVAFTVSGSYPGNVASHLFVVGVYLVALFLPSSRPSPRLLPMVLALIAVGIALCAPLLGPGLALKEALVRSTGERPEEMGWTIANWPYLVLPWHEFWAHAHDVSMVSAFVPLPVLVLVVMLRRKDVSPHAAWLYVLVTAFVMLPGNDSRIARVLYKILPPLALSRFPSSDYRAPLVLSLIVLAAASLAGMLARPDDVLARLRRGVPVVLAIFLFFAAGQAGIRVFLLDLAVIGALLAASVLTLRLLCARDARVRALAAYAPMVVAILSGSFVIAMSAESWRTTDVRPRYERVLGFYPEGALPVARRLTHPPASRPARHDTPDVLDFSWRGYLEGSYEIRDTTAPTYLGERRIYADPALFAFMQRAWQPVRLPPRAPADAETCAALHVRLADGATTDAVRSRRYGVNDAVLTVRLDAPATVVENETWFPGWRGRLVARGRTIGQVEAEPVCGGVRAWRLPAGEYALHTRYVTPHLVESVRAALVVLVAYVLFLVGALLLRRRRGSARGEQRTEGELEQTTALAPGEPGA